MGKTLYLECKAGISGDMTVAALMDLGADQKVLEESLKSLPVEGFQIQISRVKKSGLDACDFDVILDEEHENHDHDMDYLYGQVEFPEESTETGHHHEHRSIQDVRKIIEQAKMSDHAKELANRIFSILAEAESKAHGVPIDQVHFHEVGAVDSIVDVLAVSICLDNLDISEVIIPELTEGNGTVRSQHGILPVPVPAVANIAMAYQLKLHVISLPVELVTPTGAAIAAAIRTSDKLPERFVIRGIGLGAGKRDYPTSGIVRALWIEKEDKNSEK